MHQIELIFSKISRLDEVHVCHQCTNFIGPYFYAYFPISYNLLMLAVRLLKITFGSMISFEIGIVNYENLQICIWAVYYTKGTYEEAFFLS